MSVKKYIKNKVLSDYLIIKPRRYNNLSISNLIKLPNFINCNKITFLCEIMCKNGTDKGMYLGQGRHNYTPVYNAFFNAVKKKKIRLFELGIGTTNLSIPANMGQKGNPGASIRGWKQFFENGQIFGADIDETILFNEDRIKTYKCDQLNPISINEMWDSNQELSNEFDIIIDDGLHTFEGNCTFFENSFHKLKKNGIYVVEDVTTDILKEWLHYLEGFNQMNKIRFMILQIPNPYNELDNNLIMILK